MKKTLIISALSILLISCSGVDVLRVKAAAAMDAGLEAGERITCNDASIGSIVRRYGRSGEEFQRWVSFCYGDALPDMKIMQ